MVRFYQFFSRLSFAGLGVTILLSLPAQAQSYTLTDLGAVGGFFGTAVNDQGQVSGSIYVTSLGVYHAFLSGPNGGPLHDLAPSGGVNHFGYAVNGKGQVTGSNYHAFLSDANGGGLHDLGTLGGTYSAGYGVNDNGQVAGVSTTATGLYHAFFLAASGAAMRDMGTLGGASSLALGINAAGQVTGEADIPGLGSHAFLSGANGGPLHDLGTLGGRDSRGIGVNAAGQVTGYAVTADSTAGLHAFLSDANGGPLRDLGTLGGDSSYGAAINDLGQVVGYSTTDGFNGQHAFLFSGGKMIDLNSLISPASGFLLTAAGGISDTGFIVASGINTDGRQDTFLLTPVPEASTMASFGLLFTLGGAVIAARRKAKGRQTPTAA